MYLLIPYSWKIWQGIKFGSLVVYITTAKLKSSKISYSHIYVWQSRTESPNLNPLIFLQWRFWAQPLNLIPANISSYMVISAQKGGINYSLKPRLRDVYIVLWTIKYSIRLPHIFLGSPGTCNVYQALSP